MNIVQVIQRPQLRGAEIFAAQLSTHLMSFGHNVKIVCLYDGLADLPFTGEIIKLRRPYSRRLIDVVGWRQLAAIISEFDADIVQANAGDTLKFAVSSRLLFAWKAQLVYRNANKASDFIRSSPQRLLNKLLVSQTQYVISVSEICRRDFEEMYSLNEKKITTIPIGIDFSDVDGTLEMDIVTKIGAGKVALSVGSLVYEKNHQAILRMAKETRDVNRMLFLIVGDGVLFNELKSFAERERLGESVFLAGYRQRVPAIMRRADMLLMPSLIEGLPGVILEAFYNFLPVVAYNVGGISEVVKNGETGWLVDKNDERAFSLAIQDVLQYPEKTKRITSNAFALVTNHFSNAVIARRFEEVYQRLGRDAR